MIRKGIRFYITEHSENVNEQMRSLGIGHLIEEGKVRRTILAALQDAGVATPGTSMESEKSPVIQMPWQLEIPAAVHAVHEAMIPAEEENTLEEFAWASVMMRWKRWKRKSIRLWNRSIDFRIWKGLQT